MSWKQEGQRQTKLLLGIGRKLHLVVAFVPVSSLLQIGLEVFRIKESKFFFYLRRQCGAAVKSMDSQVPSWPYKSL